MRIKNQAQTISPGEISFILLLTVIFTSLNIAYSSLYGRLSAPPTYDDIGYLNGGLTLLDAGYNLGIGAWLFNTFTQTWHAPITTLQACLAFAIFGKELWAPYALNGIYLFLLIIAIRREMPSMPLIAFSGLLIGLLAWPIMGSLIIEFRPDIPTNLFIALGSWKLAKNNSRIWSDECKNCRNVWTLSWPFLFALWLKPSFSPVTIGMWCSVWGILSVSHVLSPKNPSVCIRKIAASFFFCTLLLFLCFAPYLIKSGDHLVKYFIDNVFSKNQDIWSLPLSLTDNLKYYLTGEGGKVTMGWWMPIASATSLLALTRAAYIRDYKSILVGGLYGSFAFVSWVGMTYLKNKSPWFGSIVTAYMLGLFVASISYLSSRTQTNNSKKNIKYIMFVTASVGLLLHRWPNSYGVVSATGLEEASRYSQGANRTYHEICTTIATNNLDQKASMIWVASVSIFINPTLIELCRIETNTPIKSLNPSLLNYEEIISAFDLITDLPDENLLAFVISEDFPGTPGYLPVSKHIGTINYLFDSSGKYKQIGYIDGPNGAGKIRIFAKQPVFTILEHAFGVGTIEDPNSAQNLPMVRRAKFPGAEFDVIVTPGQRIKLLLSGRAAFPEVKATLRISSGDVGHCIFTADTFHECQLEFIPENERVHVDIEFQPEGADHLESESGQLAVLLSKLQIIGEASLDSPQASTRSAFSYIDFLEGFGSVEGPYRKWKLPIVIWGRGEESRIGIAGAVNRAGILSLDWRPGDGIKGLDIQARGKTVGHCPSLAMPSTDFLNCEVNLPVGTLADGLVFRYLADQDITDKMHNSALFKLIRFIPRSGPSNN